MEAFNNHYHVPKLLKVKRLTKEQFIGIAYDNALPVAVWADGYFISPVRKRASDGRGELLGPRRLCHGQWLYLERERLAKFLFQEPVEMGFFRSDPDADVDTWATLKNSEKIHVSFNDLCIPADSLDLLPKTESARTTDNDGARKQAAKEKDKQQVRELRKAAVNAAIKLKELGIADKHITVIRICDDLLKEYFSDGTPFSSRWKTVNGIRSLLKGKHNPKANAKYRDAKTSRETFSI